MILEKLEAFIQGDVVRTNALQRQIIDAYRQANRRDNLAGFALYYEHLNLSFTYIPKNACGYLKYSFGVANGTIARGSSDDVHGVSEKQLTHSWHPHLMATKI